MGSGEAQERGIPVTLENGIAEFSYPTPDDGAGAGQREARIYGLERVGRDWVLGAMPIGVGMCVDVYTQDA